MKQLLSILIVVILFTGCRSTKKIVESSAVISNQTETVQKADIKEETKVNNDKTTYKKTTIVETKYGNRNEAKQKPSNNTTTNSKANEPIATERVVESIKTTIIEEGTKDNSVVEIKKADNSKIETKTKDKANTEIKNVEKKSVPIRWGWIFGILAFGFVVFVYFSKSKIATIVKTFIKKLFA